MDYNEVLLAARDDLQYPISTAGNVALLSTLVAPSVEFADFMAGGCHHEYWVEDHGKSNSWIWLDSPSTCGQDMKVIFDFEGYGKRPERFMERLLELPLPIRDQIYQLLSTTYDDEDHPTYWMIDYGFRISPLRAAPGTPEALAPFPTLRYKGGHWASYLSSPFCYVQGVAAKLHSKSLFDDEHAKDVLQDFLRYFGTRAVFSVHNIHRLDFNGPSVSNQLDRSIGWLIDLKPYHDHIHHLSVEFAIQKDHCGYGFDHQAAFFDLCLYIHASLPNLESIIFWIHLTKKELAAALSQPDQQEWIQKCRLLGVKNPEVMLLIHHPLTGRGLNLLGEDVSANINLGRETWGVDNAAQRTSVDPIKEAYLRKLLDPGWNIGLTDDVEDEMDLTLLFGETKYIGF